MTWCLKELIRRLHGVILKGNISESVCCGVQKGTISENTCRDVKRNCLVVLNCLSKRNL